MGKERERIAALERIAHAAVRWGLSDPGPEDPLLLMEMVAEYAVRWPDHVKRWQTEKLRPRLDEVLAAREREAEPDA